MSKHTSTRRESRNGVSMARVARLPSGSLPLRRTWPISLCIGLAIGSIAVSADALAGGPTGGTVVVRLDHPPQFPRGAALVADATAFADEVSHPP